MTTLKQLLSGSSPTNVLTTALNSLADGSGAESSSIDLGTPTPFALVIDAVVAGASASAVDLCELWLLWSIDNTNFSTFTTGGPNAQLVGTIDCDGTTAARKVFQVPISARYAKIRLQNESADALASSGNVVGYITVSVDAT